MVEFDIKSVTMNYDLGTFYHVLKLFACSLGSNLQINLSYKGIVDTLALFRLINIFLFSASKY